MNRIVLRRAEGAVQARELADDGTTVAGTSVPADRFTAFVADRERAPVRWVRDDTTRWYPALLEGGVRVERCTDLAGEQTAGWDALQPVTAADPALFPVADPADRLDPVAAERQQEVRAAAATAGRLLFGSFPVDFPLDVAVVGSWADAG